MESDSRQRLATWMGLVVPSPTAMSIRSSEAVVFVLIGRALFARAGRVPPGGQAAIGEARRVTLRIGSIGQVGPLVRDHRMS